jgi:hypothetical protein
MASDLHQVLAEAITTMGAADPAREAFRLAALISGLSLNAVTPTDRSNRQQFEPCWKRTWQGCETPGPEPEHGTAHETCCSANPHSCRIPTAGVSARRFVQSGSHEP